MKLRRFFPTDARSLCLAVACAACLSAPAQQPMPLQQAQFDPTEVYFQGYMATRDAEKLEQSGDFQGALDKLQRANQMFDTIRKFYPDWKPDMLGKRSVITAASLARVKPLAEDVKNRDRGVIAELEGGVRRPAAEPARPSRADVAVTSPTRQSPSSSVAPPPTPPVPAPSILDVDPLALKKLREAEQERDRLKQLLAEQTTRARLNEQARIDAESKTRSASGDQETLRRQAEQYRLQAEKLRQETEEYRQQASRQLQQQTEQLRQQAAAERSALQQKLRDEVERLRNEAAAKETKLQQDLAKLQDSAKQPSGAQSQDDAANQAREEATRIAMQRQVELEVNRIRQEAQAKEESIAAEMERLRAETRTKEQRIRSEKENQLAEAEAREKSLRAENEKLMAEAKATEERLRREAEQLRQQARTQGDLTGRNADLEARIAAAENQVQSLRSQLAAAPLQSDMDGLNQRIETLEQERRALGSALGKSREEHDQAMARIKTLEADLQVSRQKYADMERNLAVQNNLSNEVVAGQRRQLRDLEKKLADKDQELAKANERIAGLSRELEESRAAFAELRQERDSLLLERDQMAAVLKLNEGGRVQELIEQNMALARDLRVANEKVERLHKESNEDKDAITNAMRDLAIAKAQINRLQQEKRAQDRRLAEMEAKLRKEEQSLASGNASADPAEVEMLREVIRRQLRVQERRRQARDILLDAVRDLGQQDDQLAGAIDLFDAQEIELSPEEMKLLADKPVDGEFVSPFARDRATVGRATDKLRGEISAFERAAEKSFLAGRYLSTREIYQTILEQNPGHTPSLCRIGVVHLKLGEPDAAADMFRRAVELDEGNPYAHRMLGFSLMKVGDPPGAESSARRAVELAPDDATSHMLLATILYRTGRVAEAESHFKAAITADPMPSEPYYNLALISSRKGRKDDARDFYQQALERGAVPDPKLEQALR